MAGINYQHKLVFMSNHKTGSTSIDDFLIKNHILNYKFSGKPQWEQNKRIWKHCTKEQIIDFSDRNVGVHIDGTFKYVSFTRNPFDRCRSLWKFWYNVWHKYKDINNFIKSDVFSKYRFSNFNFDLNGNQIPDYLFQIENIPEFKEFIKGYGFKIHKPIKRLNVTKPKSVKNSEYNQKSLDIISEKFKYEIEHFNYKIK